MNYQSGQVIATRLTEFIWNDAQQTVEVAFKENLPQPKVGFSLSLHLDQITGREVMPVLGIYLNLKDRKKPEQKHFIGKIALYGIGTSEQHRVFQVDDVFQYAHNQHNWSEKSFFLTLIPDLKVTANATFAIGRITLIVNQY